MKIVIVGPPEFDSLEFHLHDELKHSGHDAKIIDFKKPLPGKFDFGLTLVSAKYELRKNRQLLENVLTENPELVIVVYRHVQPFVVREIKNRNIKIIHLNPDALTTFQGQQIFAEAYDHYFTKDPYILRFMRDKLNLNVHLYQEAFNPRFHNYEIIDFKKLEDEINIDILTFGNLYPYRNRMISQIKDHGIDIKLFGHKSKFYDMRLLDNFQNRAIFGEEKARILNGSKIVFNNFHYAEIESVNNKFFEVIGSGAFQICDYKPILNDLLPIDPKKVSFETLDEAIALMKHYLRNPEERWEIRNVLKKHFAENYTYKELIKELLNTL